MFIPVLIIANTLAIVLMVDFYSYQPEADEDSFEF